LSKLRSIIARLSERDPDAAQRLQVSIYEKIAFLRSFPFLAEVYQRVAEGEIRETQVGSYRIFYLVSASEPIIRILRIQHVRMNDPDWGE